ncbi:unnamed protein product [Adineta steineri]|uniref:Uncharacterized protein n=1 Tax=Adineta steineri TaxID=433720 RepID=A0A819I9F1_9BILA|nr:unnamed protein product [Adineta steineri]CAF3911094.1 unnamed protein product [Adineta steineri]
MTTNTNNDSSSDDLWTNLPECYDFDFKKALVVKLTLEDKIAARNVNNELVLWDRPHPIWGPESNSSSCSYNTIIAEKVKLN